MAAAVALLNGGVNISSLLAEAGRGLLLAITQIRDAKTREVNQKLNKLTDHMGTVMHELESTARDNANKAIKESKMATFELHELDLGLQKLAIETISSTDQFLRLLEKVITSADQKILLYIAKKFIRLLNESHKVLGEANSKFKSITGTLLEVLIKVETFNTAVQAFHKNNQAERKEAARMATRNWWEELWNCDMSEEEAELRKVDNAISRGSTVISTTGEVRQILNKTLDDIQENAENVNAWSAKVSEYVKDYKTSDDVLEMYEMDNSELEIVFKSLNEVCIDFLSKSLK